MSEQLALDGFLDKWRSRWPEWNVVEVFVPMPRRVVAVAWLALQQELLDAAWAGTEPQPGEAKLGWWIEELQGWSQGRRRHPLGFALQREPAPWLPLAAHLPTLLASREVASNPEQAAGVLATLAEAIDRVGDALFAVSTRDSAVTIHALLAQQILSRGDAAAPLHIRARMGEVAGELAMARAWATDLLGHWPARRAESRVSRIVVALLQARLRRFTAGHKRSQPLPRLPALWIAWRAARG
jgi:phytoene/squalene synthetase